MGVDYKSYYFYDERVDRRWCEDLGVCCKIKQFSCGIMEVRFDRF